MSEPSIATATTSIVATPNEAKPLSPVTNMPAIATITVRPEISTDRPEVAAAASSAAALAPALRAFLTLAPEVEHRVVDADRDPDQEHERRDLVGHREHVARQGDQAERAEHGREREQQRDPRGDEPRRR